MIRCAIRPGQAIKSSSGNFYQIQKYLGRGGNAISYRVGCTSGSYRGLFFVAKILYNLSSPKRIERFNREADFLKNTVHPSILRHHDSGKYLLKSNNTTYPFVITNYMPDTLAKCLEENSLSFKDKILFSCNLLNALIFLREKNIVHRDIKPGNIFIDNHNAVLGDFGLMKDLSYDDPFLIEDDKKCLNDSVAHENTIDGYVAMPYFFRTPELVNFANGNDKLHIESDIFQLGLVFAEMFTGENPLVPGDLKSPIVLNRISHVTDANQHGGLVFRSIKEMLSLDYSQRPHPNETLDHFLQIYENIITNENLSQE